MKHVDSITWGASRFFLACAVAVPVVIWKCRASGRTPLLMLWFVIFPMPMLRGWAELGLENNAWLSNQMVSLIGAWFEMISKGAVSLAAVCLFLRRAKAASAPPRDPDSGDPL